MLGSVIGVSVLVPLAGDGDRGDLWRWLRHEHIAPEHPEWEIVVGDSYEGEAFSKGRAVAKAAGRASGDVFVIHDADALVNPLYLDAAVEAVAVHGVPWVVPHATVHRMSRMASARVRAGAPSSEWEYGVQRTHPAVVGGGVSVMHRDAYDEVGGVDDRFKGWGGEDIAFGWALDLLVGPHRQLDAALWHLWHEPGLRRRGHRPLNECLAGAYRQAYEAGDVDRMRRLCAREEAC